MSKIYESSLNMKFHLKDWTIYVAEINMLEK